MIEAFFQMALLWWQSQELACPHQDHGGYTETVSPEDAHMQWSAAEPARRCPGPGRTEFPTWMASVSRKISSEQRRFWF